MLRQVRLFPRFALKAFFLTILLVLALTLPAQSQEMAQEIKTLLSIDSPLSPELSQNKKDLRTFYERRAYAPAWVVSQENKDVLTGFLSTTRTFAAYHGLNENDYPIAQLEKQIDHLGEADATKLELLITSWLLQIAHDLQGDSVNLTHLYPGWTFTRAKKDVALGLAQAIADDKIQAFFDSLPPQSLTYTQLAGALKTYRELLTAEHDWPRVAPGPAMNPGVQDARLTQVRERLKAEGYQFQSPSDVEGINFYDDTLKNVVIAYQSRNGLQADGVIGGQTIAALNVSLLERIGQISANMERLRHRPDYMPQRYALVNIADASIEVIDNGQTLYHDVVIVGQPERKTPFIQSSIRSVIFNPSWHVPAKIAREDILPKLRKDPHYLEKMGFVIKGSANDPHGEQIDWKTIKASEFNFRLRQSPGDLNSLGQIKFDFDNDYAVYLHDTSHPEKFASPNRFLSSGCVRIKNPTLLAQLVLAHTPGNWSPETIDAAIANGKSRWQKVEDPLPLFLVYETAFFPMPDSLINFRRDVYGYDSFLLEALAKGQARR